MRCTRRTVALVLLLIFVPLCALAQTVAAPFSNLRGVKTRASFEYTDELFSGKAATLKPGLAIASVCLAASAHDREDVRDTLGQMGFGGITFYDFNKEDWTATDNHYVSHTLARKDISLNGKAYTLYVVAVSGTRGYDWISDFDVGGDREHKGFSLAADRVMKNLDAFVSTPTSQNIFWITGHSRGAAVGNIVGARLTGCCCYAPASRIFCYTSATPATTRKKTLYGAGSYKNVIALNNPADFITRIPMQSWGYRTYGRAIQLPNQGRIYQKMLANFQKLVGYGYGGQTVQTAKQLSTQSQKYGSSLKRYLSGVAWRDGRGTHLPSKFFNGLALVLVGGKERYEGLKMMLDEIEKSDYAMNIAALMLGMKLPCTREQLGARLASLDVNNPLAAMGGVAFPHTLEAYISWVNALYA